MGERAIVCPRCSRQVALQDGRPFIDAGGNVELWHASCWAVRNSRPVEEVTVIAPQAPQRKRVAHVFDSGTVATVTRNLRSAKRAAIAIAGLAFVGAAGYGVTVDHETRALAAIQIDPPETFTEAVVTTT